MRKSYSAICLMTDDQSQAFEYKVGGEYDKGI